MPDAIAPTARVLLAAHAPHFLQNLCLPASYLNPTQQALSQTLTQWRLLNPGSTETGANCWGRTTSREEGVVDTMVAAVAVVVTSGKGGFVHMGRRFWPRKDRGKRAGCCVQSA